MMLLALIGTIILAGVFIYLAYHSGYHSGRDDEIRRHLGNGEGG